MPSKLNLCAFNKAFRTKCLEYFPFMVTVRGANKALVKLCFLPQKTPTLILWVTKQF